MADHEQRATYKAIADFGAFFKELDRAEAGLAKFRAQAAKDIKVTVEVDVDEKAFKEKVQAAAKSVKPEDIKVGLDVDRKAFSERVGAAVKAVRPDAIKVGLDVDRAAFSQRVQAAVAAVRPEAVRVKLDVDQTGFSQRVRAAVAAVRTADVKVKLDVDQTGFSQRVRSAVAAVRPQDLRVKLDVDSSGFAARVRSAVAAVNAPRIKVGLDVDASGLRSRVSAAAASVRDVRVQVGVDLDVSGLRARLQAALTQASAGLRITVPVDADGGHLRAEIRAIIAAASAGQQINIPVNAGGGGLGGGGAAAGAAAFTALSGGMASAAASAAGLTAAYGALAVAITGLVGAATALVGALAPVVAVMGGALPSAALGFTAVIGSLVAAFAGPLGALKALSAAEKESASSAASGAKAAQSAANARASAAQTVASAQTGLQRAYENAADAQAQAARRVTDAEASVTEARQRAADANTEAAARVGQAQQNQARVAADAADANVEAADRVREAQVGVAEAIQRAAEANAAAQRRAQDAQESLAEAARQAADANVAAAQRTQDAQASLADSYRSVAEANARAAVEVASAEGSLSRAQRDVRQSQLDLNAARRQAVSDLDDMRRAVRQTALDERDGALAVQEALQRLNEVRADPKASKLERERAQLSYERAVISLDDLRKRQEQQRQDYVKTSQAGVNGTDRVKSAQEALNDALQRQGEAQTGLATAQAAQAKTAAAGQRTVIRAQQDVVRAQQAQAQAAVDGQRSVARAQRDVADAQAAAAKTARDGQEAVARAAQEVADAQRAQAKTAVEGQKSVVKAQRDVVDALAAQQKSARDSARAIEDAQRSLANAQRSMAQALQEQTAGTSAAAARAAAALAKLTPEARAVVAQILAMKPAWEEIQRVAQQRMMPGVLSALKDIQTTLPNLKKIVGDTAGVMGRLAADFGKMFASPAWQRDLVSIGQSNARVLDSLGHAGLNVLDVFRNLAAVAQPFIEGWARMVEKTTATWKAQVQTARETGRLTELFQKAKETLQSLGRIIGNTFSGLWTTLQVGYPYGRALLDQIEGWTAKFKTWTKTAEGQQQLNEFFKGSVAIFGLLAGAIGLVVGWLLDVVRKLGQLADWDRAHGEPIRRTFEDIGAAVKVIADLVVDNLLAGLRSVATWVQANRDALAGVFDAALPVIQSVIDLAGSIAAALARSFVALSPAIVGALDPVNAALRGLKEIVDTLAPVLEDLGRFIGEQFMPYWRELSKFITDHVVPAFKSIADFVRDVVVPVFKGILDVWTDLGVVALKILGPAVDAVKAVFDGLRAVLAPLAGLIREHKELIYLAAAAWVALNRAMITNATLGLLHRFGSIIGSIRGALSGVPAMLSGFVAGLRNLGGGSILMGAAALTGIALAIVAVANAIDAWANASDRSKKKIEALTAAIKNQPGDIRSYTDSLKNLREEQENLNKKAGLSPSIWSNIARGIQNAAGLITGSTEQMISDMGAVDDAIGRTNQQVSNYYSNIRSLSALYGINQQDLMGLVRAYKLDFTGSIKDADAALRDVLQRMADGTPTTARLKDRVGELAGKEQEASDRAQTFADNLDRLFKPFSNYEGATQNVAQDLQELGTRAQEAGGSFGNLADGFGKITPAQLALRQAVKDTVDDIGTQTTRYRDQLVAQGVSQDEADRRAAAFYDAQIGHLRDWGAQNGISRGDMDRFLATLGNYPAGAGQAAAGVEDSGGRIRDEVARIGREQESGTKKSRGWSAMLKQWADRLVQDLIAPFQAIGRFFGRLPGYITAVLRTGWGMLRGAGRGLMDRVSEGVLGALGRVVGFFAGIPGRVTGVLRVGWGLLTQAGAGLMGAVARGVLSVLGRVVGFFAGIPGRVTAVLRTGWGLLTQAGAGLLGAVTRGVLSGLGGFVGFFTGLPGRIVATLQAGWGILWGGGGAILGWMRDGVVAAAGDFVSFFSDLPGKIWAAVQVVWEQIKDIGKRIGEAIWQGIKDALNPAKLFEGATSGKTLNLPGLPPIPWPFSARGGFLPPGTPALTAAQPFAVGGFLPRQALIQAPRPGLVQWAEPSTHGEAFIPLTSEPGQRGRSVAVWQETGRILGQFAVGGIRSGTGGRPRSGDQSADPGSGKATLVVTLDAATPDSRELILGFVEGLTKAVAASAGDIKRDVTDRIIALLREPFGIASPSKLTAGYGRSLVDGLTQGMIAQAPTLTRATTAVVGQVGGIATGTTATVATVGQQVGVYAGHVTGMAAATEGATGRVGKAHGVQSASVALLAQTHGQRTGQINVSSAGMAGATEGAAGRVVKAHGAQGGSTTGLATLVGARTGQINASSKGMAGATEAATKRVVGAQGAQGGSATGLAALVGTRHGDINKSSAGMATGTEKATGRVTAAHGRQQGSATFTAALVGTRHGDINKSSAGMAGATEGVTNRIVVAHGRQQGSATTTATTVGTRYGQINAGSVRMASTTEAQTGRVNAAYTGMQRKVDSLHGKSINVVSRANVTYPPGAQLAAALTGAVNALSAVTASPGPGTQVADGAIFQRAHGGIDHVPALPGQALISPARGPGLVQWAEAETGGEAFIPLAPAKRGRSLAIWAETGRRLGAFFEGGLLNVGTSLDTGNWDAQTIRLQTDTEANAVKMGKVAAVAMARVASQAMADTAVGVLVASMAPKGPGFSMSGSWAPGIRAWVEYIAKSLNISAMTYGDHHPAMSHAVDLAVNQDGMKRTAGTGPSGTDLYSEVARWIDDNILSKPTPGWYQGTHAAIHTRGGGWHPASSQVGRRGTTFAHDDHVHLSFDPRSGGPVSGRAHNYSEPHFNWDHGGAPPSVWEGAGRFGGGSALERARRAKPTIIGDSISVGSRAALLAAMPGAAFAARGSMPWSWGRGALRSVGARSTVAYLLGTNMGASTGEMASLVDAYPGSKFALQTVSVPQPYEGSTNAAVRATAGRYPGRVSVADWYAAVQGNPGLLSSDRVHPTPAGQQAFANVVATAIGQIAPSLGGGYPGPPGHYNTFRNYNGEHWTQAALEFAAHKMGASPGAAHILGAIAMAENMPIGQIIRNWTGVYSGPWAFQEAWAARQFDFGRLNRDLDYAAQAAVWLYNQPQPGGYGPTHMKWQVWPDMARPYLASGGVVPPSARPGVVGQFLAAGGRLLPRGTDTVPAMLTPGEYVLNREVVADIGVGTLDRLNQRRSRRRPDEESGYYAGGGAVLPPYIFNPRTPAEWRTSLNAHRFFGTLALQQAQRKWGHGASARWMANETANWNNDLRWLQLIVGTALRDNRITGSEQAAMHNQLVAVERRSREIQLGPPGAKWATDPKTPADYTAQVSQAVRSGQAARANLVRKYSRNPKTKVWAYLQAVSWDRQREAMRTLADRVLSDLRLTGAETTDLKRSIAASNARIKEMNAGPPRAVIGVGEEKELTRRSVGAANVIYNQAMKRRDLTGLPAAKKDIDAVKAGMDSLNKATAAAALDQIISGPEHKALEAARASLAGKRGTVENWIKYGPAYGDIRDQEEQNKRNTNFRNWVLQIAGWGLTYLANWLTSQSSGGTEDYYTKAQQFAGNKAAATAMNKSLEAASKILTGPDLATATNLLAALAKTPNLGLREAGDAVAKVTGGSADLAGLVAVVPRITAELGKLPDRNKAKFLADVKAWNAGVPFAEGGLVTPSLFMAGGGQAPVLGFDAGGGVEFLSSPAVVHNRVGGTVNRTAPNVGTVVIHNPVAQTSEESLRRTVSKLRFLGAFK